MRIAHFIQGRCSADSPNGVDKTAYYLSRAQGRLGHDVAMFSLTSKPAKPIDNVAVETFAGGSRLKLPAQLLHALREWRPDIVHFHSANVTQNVVLARHLRRWDVPYVVTPNGVLSPRLLRRRPHVKLPFRYLVERPYLSRAAFVHAVSANEHGDFRLAGVRAPIVDAPNGIDAADLPAEIEPQRLRERFPQIGERRVALFIGRLDIMQKGLDLLLEALQAGRGRLNDLALVIVGSEWLGSRDLLRRSIRRGGLSEQVILDKPVYGKLKFDLMAGADVFVHVSRWEGLPFAVLEALACATPCLLTAATNLAGHLERYDAGRVVKPDSEEIADVLGFFATAERGTLEALGRNARKLIRDEFSWRKIAQSIVAAYADVLQRPAPDGGTEVGA